jgi:uncharacterized protein (DUF362 family)
MAIIVSIITAGFELVVYLLIVQLPRNEREETMDRRTFLKTSIILGGASLSAAWPQRVTATSQTQPVSPPTFKSRVAFVKTDDRTAGVKKALGLLSLNQVKGKNMFLKPNFNSADAAPGSTHPDTLSALVMALQTLGADRLAVGDRSGMGDTRRVMEQKGIFRMADELAFETVLFDELAADDWLMQQMPGSHWQQGFAVPRPMLEADGVVQTCCLKTHRYGGHFTLSLKNSVGLAAKWVPGEGYNYMTELHNSSHQRRMIAEINTAYQPDLVVLDGVEAFVEGGPAQGKKVQANLILAGNDRVAIDAVGVAVLRHFGTTPEVSQGPIFEQEQIARAVELGLGVGSPDQIALITDDRESAAYARQIQEILLST